MPADFVTSQEIVLAGRRNLEQGPWDYLTGGSESETTMRRNRLGFDQLGFRPRVGVDVAHVDPSTTFLGHPLKIPVLTAPIGSLQVFAAGGAADVALAAAQFGTIPVISSSTQPSLEETAAATSSPKIFQLYVEGDWTWLQEVLKRVRDAGYVALALTADTAVYSRRERPMLGRYAPPTRRNPADPKWRASITWDLMDRIKDHAELPFMLKGVATAEDAAMAIEHGVDVIWVSNHGGRQLDHGMGAIQILPEIVQAVAGRADVIMDGGVLRGGDVIKALALGAKAVAIGKLQGWGLAAGGVDGLVRVLELLEDEMRVAMALLGVTRVNQLAPAFITRADPVVWPHEMSAFPDIPGGRVV
jgi:isopentenyl diphosphate isomerase/L-lactate dehydrogenase-like FMN-dependent dehydrogenase